MSIEIREASVATLPDDLVPSLAEFRTALLREIDPSEPEATPGWALRWLHPGNEVARKRSFVAVEGGAVVGCGTVNLDLAGNNTHLADLRIEVHPRHRRRGYGRRLLGAMAEAISAEGRTSVVPWGIRSAAAEGFWSAFDAPEVAIDVMSRLRPADVDPGLIERWRSTPLAAERGYVLSRWRGRCPQDLMAPLVEAQAAMNDAPTEGLEMGDDLLDEHWNRHYEQSLEERGSQGWGMVVVAPDGAGAGMTQIEVSEHRPSFVIQQGTSTGATHRNQGIGRWLKAEMIHWLGQEWPSAEVIETGNADSNAPMRSINKQLGFQTHVELTTRQLDIKALRGALDRHK